MPRPLPCRAVTPFRLASALLAVTATAAPCRAVTQQTDGWRPVPVRFDHGLMFVRVDRPAASPVLLFTDTGGGSDFLWPEAVRRFGLRPAERVNGADTTRSIAWTALGAAGTTPPPTGDLIVSAPPPPLEGDGMLGRLWFANRSWRIDYVRGAAWWRDGSAGLAGGPGTTALGFQADSTGARTTHFPRVMAVIDGDSLPLLFDTGAHVATTAASRRALRTDGPTHATSFIADSIFGRWRRTHPDWQVVDSADARGGAAMILVPSVRLAGVDLGPAWFTRRADANFGDFMSRWTDRPVVGALGGSAFAHAEFTLDYPAARLAVRRVR